MTASVLNARRAIAGGLLCVLAACSARTSRSGTSDNPVLAKLTLRRSVILQQPDSALVGEVTALAVGPDGRILVADQVQVNAKLYDSTGHLLRVIGRRGHGPGEFQFPRHAQFTPDHRIVVADARGAIQEFSASGDVRRTITPTGLTFYLGVRVLASGDFLILGGNGRKFMLVRYDSAGGHPRELFQREGVPVADHPESPLWTRLNLYFFAADGDTAFVVASLSDTIWKVNVNTGTVSPVLMRFDGFARPKLPADPPRDESDDWAKAFYRTYRPFAGRGLVVVPFARGYRYNSDGQAAVIRSPKARWLAINDAPMIMAVTDSDLVEPEVDDSGAVRVNFYRVVAASGTRSTDVF
jgi:hypothetical protein